MGQGKEKESQQGGGWIGNRIEVGAIKRKVKAAGKADKAQEVSETEEKGKVGERTGI